MPQTRLNVLYAKKGYQKKMVEYYKLKHGLAKKPGYKSMYLEKARYHARKFNELDKMIKMIER